MKEKVRLAAALRYQAGKDNAPTVVAAGKGEVASAIKRMAEDNNIPVYQDKSLARTLTELGLGVEIPPELYEVVAKILVHVATLDNQLGPGSKK